MDPIAVVIASAITSGFTFAGLWFTTRRGEKAADRLESLGVGPEQAKLDAIRDDINKGQAAKITLLEQEHLVLQSQIDHLKERVASLEQANTILTTENAELSRLVAADRLRAARAVRRRRGPTDGQ